MGIRGPPLNENFLEGKRIMKQQTVFPYMPQKQQQQQKSPEATNRYRLKYLISVHC